LVQANGWQRWFQPSQKRGSHDQLLDAGAPGTLPFTGSHTPLLLAIGSALLVAGTGLVPLMRRRARLAH
jgi:LPXTG-motif cell wall-anchored protein